ncbi:TBC1 domain family member 2A isoform X1 [Paramormyrops kingsleyae]|uniref:TBC1 domain family member 2A isoform X1 n=2 Tax=Paramormyrops kingsleyae TaxID=1676925 RepID=UPI003B971E2A
MLCGIMERHGPEGNPTESAHAPLPLHVDLPSVCKVIIELKSLGETTENGMGATAADEGRPCEERMGWAAVSAPTKLCGYLHKLGGPLRSWKCRWFTYEEGKCQLFYYRTPQDANPLGHVELARATFGYPLRGDEGTFHVQTPERTFVLKALNRQTMMYWLQQLQLKRWQHRSRTSAGSAQLCGETEADDWRATRGGGADGDFLPTVKTPTGLVGEAAAGLPAPKQRAMFSNVSFKHPLTEIQNSVHSLRLTAFRLGELPEAPSPATEPKSLCPPPGDTVSPKLPEPPGERWQEDRRSSCLSLSPSMSLRSRRKKKRAMSSTMPTDLRDVTSSDKTLVLSLAEEVKSQKELVWLLHKALEAAQQEKRSCAQFLSADGEQERLELLRHRERHAADLGTRLEALRSQREALQQRLMQRDGHVAELQEQVRMMMEKDQAKQEVILRLSEQLAASSNEAQKMASVSSKRAETTQEEIDNLKDDIEAYKLQNQFLNSEIYQLTKLWRNSSEQEKSLMVKCAHLEARSCQMESRYLGVLRKLQECKGLEAGEREAVRHLVEEALQREAKDPLSLDPVREYDEYGFKIVPDYEVEDVKLLARIQALEIRSNNLLQQEAEDRPLDSRWAQYLGGRLSGELAITPELKTLMRSGVPVALRPRVWRWVVGLRTRSLRERHPDRYRELCGRGQSSEHAAARQIQLDLHRTLSSNWHFSSPTSPTLKQLHRILLAFSWQNPTIGYCQGLNRLAAIALLVLENEEDAFWCLVAIVEAIMPQDYYSKTLIASQADQRVLKDFMAEKMPRLMAHLEEHNADVSLVTFNWFLVLFVESLTSDILLRVWDAVLYEGSKVLFRYAMAIFKYKEEDILKIHDNLEIYQYLRFFTKTITDGRRLTNIAFNELNPFPMRLLRSRRAQHLERLQVELRELELLQQELVANDSDDAAQCVDKGLDTTISEDDDD